MIIVCLYHCILCVGAGRAATGTDETDSAFIGSQQEGKF